MTFLQGSIEKPEIPPFTLSLATGSAVFAIYFMIAAMTIASPFIGHTFFLNEIEIGLLIQAHLFAMVIFLIPAGRLGDRFGHHFIFLSGCLIFATCSLGCAFSPSAEALIFGRFLQGIGDAMIMTSSYVLLTRSNRAKTGSSIGWFLGAAYFGYLSGTLLSGLLTDFVTWRAVFLAVVPFTCIAFVLIARTSTIHINRTSREPNKIDGIGFILFAFGTLALFSGVNHIAEPIGPPAITAGVVLLILYAINEKKASNPQIPFLIFKENPFFSFSILADLTYYLCMGSTTFLISLYLATVQGFSATIISSILLAVPVMQGLLSPVSGHISDTHQPRKVASIGLLFVFFAQISFLTLSENPEIPFLILALLTTGAGFGFFSASNKTAIMRSVSPRYHGTVSGLATTVEQFGNLFSVGIASAVFALTLGNVAITPAVAVPFLSGFHLVFGISLVLCVTTIVFSLLRGDLPVEDNT